MYIRSFLIRSSKIELKINLLSYRLILGILKELSDSTFKFLPEFNDETSNASDQSVSMSKFVCSILFFSFRT